MLNVDGWTDGRTDGLTDERTKGRKLARLCLPAKAGATKSANFVVPPLFRADSGTNLIKQGENVKGRPSDSEA